MKKLTRLIWGAWLLLSVLVYASVLVSPLNFAYSSIVSFGIPVVVACNGFFLLISILFKSKKWPFFLLGLVFSYPFFAVTFQLGNKSLETEDNDFTVLNYNVKWFTEATKDNYKAVIDWIDEADADILCFQEFYPKKGIESRIKQNGKYHIATFKKRFNVALMSKFPIVQNGLLLPESDLNNILFADLKVKEDTIRVYSIHLQSMGINPQKLQNTDGIKSEYQDVKFRILEGSKDRTSQIKVLLEHVNASPYPVILAGDFNDVPYSYNYFSIKRELNNAFEEKGKFFGFTFNNGIPFLRIDNQFFNNELELVEFEVFNKVYYSDHYPVMGKYRISD